MARSPDTGPLPWLAAAGLLGIAFGRAAACPLPPTRSALVTGGSRGLGLLIAREYQRRGARVSICARDPDTLLRAKALLDAAGPPVAAFSCDVSSEGEVEATVAAAVRTCGGIDTVVNDAGVISVGPAAHMTPADYEEALRVNFLGALRVTRAALPQLRRRGGRVVNISSIGGLLPVPHLLPYCTSKWALTGWSLGLRSELAREGVRVTTVCPALMRTGSPRHARFKGRHRAEYAWFSVSDSLPGLSIDARRAAARIVRAAEAGRALLVLPAWARLPVLLQGVAPGAFAAMLAAANRLLPDPGGIGAAARLGRDSASGWSPSLLTTLTERAERRYNQLGPGERRGLPQG